MNEWGGLRRRGRQADPSARRGVRHGVTRGDPMRHVGRRRHWDGLYRGGRHDGRRRRAHEHRCVRALPSCPEPRRLPDHRLPGDRHEVRQYGHQLQAHRHETPQGDRQRNRLGLQRSRHGWRELHLGRRRPRLARRAHWGEHASADPRRLGPPRLEVGGADGGAAT